MIPRPDSGSSRRGEGDRPVSRSERSPDAVAAETREPPSFRPTSARSRPQRAPARPPLRTPAPSQPTPTLPGPPASLPDESHARVGPCSFVAFPASDCDSEDGSVIYATKRLRWTRLPLRLAAGRSLDERAVVAADAGYCSSGTLFTRTAYTYNTRHLEKQNDLLMEAYRSMSHELHKLQVEEEMLMRKFYDIMESQSPLKKSNDKGASNDMGNGDSTSATRDDSQR